MLNEKRPINILIAEDDEDDFSLLEEALDMFARPVKKYRTIDGEELLEVLFHPSEGSEVFALPDLILLDLNMPKKNGFEALTEIRKTPGLRQTPVVILSTSKNKEDINKAHELGANHYIAKEGILESLNFEKVLEGLLLKTGAHSFSLQNLTCVN
jgi:CheY-like chemotaxis protein